MKILTGISEFDIAYGGIEPGQLTIIGGRAGCGKTTFSMVLTKTAGLDKAIPIAYFGEEKVLKMAVNLVSLAGSCNLSKLGSSPIYLEDARILDDDTEFDTLLTRLVAMYRVKVVVLDCNIIANFQSRIVKLQKLANNLNICIVVTVLVNKLNIEEFLQSSVDVSIVYLDYPERNNILKFNFINNLSL